jgi:hypothetical protein
MNLGISVHFKHIVIVLSLYFLPQIVWAKVDDDDLKAVYLFRFALLADWSKTGVNYEYIEYCVTSSSDVSERLQAIVESKPDRARFHRLPVSSDANVCHILFTELNDKEAVAQLRERYPHALLVGNGIDFVANGGMIAFIKVRNRIRPLIAREHVRHTNVLLRSQLLEVSELYQGGTA